MTIQTRLGPEQAAQEVLVEAEALFTRTVGDLHELVNEVKAGKFEHAKELRGVLRDLRQTSLTAYEERSKVEKRLRAEAGILNDYTFDLDGARSKIRGRLDRLRNAAGAGGVPEGS